MVVELYLLILEAFCIRLLVVKWQTQESRVFVDVFSFHFIDLILA